MRRSVRATLLVGLTRSSHCIIRSTAIAFSCSATYSALRSTDRQFCVWQRNESVWTMNRRRSPRPRAQAILPVAAAAAVASTTTTIPMVGSSAFAPKRSASEIAVTASAPIPTDSSAVSANATGIFMLLSPAKTLDLSPWEPPSSNGTLFPPLTLPSCDLTKTNAIASMMKELSQTELAKKLKVSAKLAQSTWDHWQAFSTTTTTSDESATATTIDPHTEQRFGKPCVYMYSGAAFQGLDVVTCTTTDVVYLQNNLRILDAVYGMLRPLDQIQAYRLDFNSKLNIEATSHPNPPYDLVVTGNKLTDYWIPTVVDRFHTEIQARIDVVVENDPNSLVIVLNLASVEYATLLGSMYSDWFLHPRPHARWIDVVFCEASSGRIVAAHAKRARGLMARYVAQTSATTLAQVQAFDGDGYRYNDAVSSETRFVFERHVASLVSSSVATAKPLPKASSAATRPAKRRATEKSSSTVVVKQR